MPIEYLINAFVTLFVTIDPIGLAPIFVAVTAGLSAKEKRNTAVRAVIIAIVILWLSAFFGEILLDALGISLPAFRIAGGLMLFWIGFEMVFERRTQRKSKGADQAKEEKEEQDLAAFPLAIPMMAGPGSITAVILLAGEIEDGNWETKAVLAGIISGILVLCLVIFLAAGVIERLMGVTGRIILSRLLGVILAALAVQFLVDGVRELLLA